MISIDLPNRPESVWSSEETNKRYQYCYHIILLCYGMYLKKYTPPYLYCFITHTRDPWRLIRVSRRHSLLIDVQGHDGSRAHPAVFVDEDF